MMSNVRIHLFEVNCFLANGTRVEEQKLVRLDDKGNFLFLGENLALSEEDFVFFAKRSHVEIIEIHRTKNTVFGFTLNTEAVGMEHLERIEGYTPIGDKVNKTESADNNADVSEEALNIASNAKANEECHGVGLTNFQAFAVSLESIERTSNDSGLEFSKFGINVTAFSKQKKSVMTPLQKKLFLNQVMSMDYIIYRSKANAEVDRKRPPWAYPLTSRKTLNATGFSIANG